MGPEGVIPDEIMCFFPLSNNLTHLERQRGGMGFLGGPGETQIEADKRAINLRK